MRETTIFLRNNIIQIHIVFYKSVNLKKFEIL